MVDSATPIKTGEPDQLSTPAEKPEAASAISPASIDVSPSAFTEPPSEDLEALEDKAVAKPKPKRTLSYHLKKKVRKASMKIQKGTLSLSRSFSNRVLSRGSSGRLIKSESEEMKDDSLEIQRGSSSASASFSNDGDETPGVLSEPSSPGEGGLSASFESNAAAAEVEPAPGEGETPKEESANATDVPKKENGDAEAGNVKVDPLGSSAWPTPAESAMARKVELLDEVDELVKSGVLKDAYSAQNPKDLAGKEASYAPVVTVSKGVVHVHVDHEMTPESHISMIWIQDAFGKPLAAQKFVDITTDSKVEAVLDVPIANVLATVSDSVVDVTAYAVWNQDGTWSSESVQVTAEEVVSGKAKAKLVATVFVALPLLFLLFSVLLKPLSFVAGPKEPTDFPAVHTQIDGWTILDTRNGVTTSSVKVGDSPFLGYRAETITDTHISNLMTVFLNTSDAVNWVKDLESLSLVDLSYGQKSLCPSRTSCAVYFQHYHMPWPVGDREFVLLRSISIDRKAKKVSGLYHSVEDERFPEKDGIVRGNSDHTYWHFRALEDGTTEIVLEAIVQPKGSLPAKAVNFLSRSWPKHTIENLVKRANVVDEAHAQYSRW